MSKVWKIYYTEQKEEIIQADDYEEMFGQHRWEI